jgi:predicted Ser/Thr protein kinase
MVLDDLDSRIMDFESASRNRRPKNLTSLYQYLFIKSPAAQYLRKLYGIKSVEEIRKLLHKYKVERDMKISDILSNL